MDTTEEIGIWKTELKKLFQLQQRDKKIRKIGALKNRDRTNTYLIVFPEGDNREHVREE